MRSGQTNDVTENALPIVALCGFIALVGMPVWFVARKQNRKAALQLLPAEALLEEALEPQPLRAI